MQTEGWIVVGGQVVGAEPESSVELRCAVEEETVDVDVVEEALLPYDLLLLCSDGLTDMVSDWQIAETIDENIADLETAVKKLIALANQNGGKDNISVILMQT